MLIVEHRESHLDLIAGDWGEANVHLTFEDPWGNGWQVMSGTKPEYGLGGFECGIRPAADGYEVRADTQSWMFYHRGGGMTFLRWTDEPEPPSPSPEPTPSPEPPPEPGRIPVQPGRIYSAVLEDGEITWHEGERDDATWTYVGHYLPGANLWLPEREPALPLLAAWVTELRLRTERLERGLLRRI